MMAAEDKKHFSYRERSTLSIDEKLADKKLTALKSKLVTPLYNVTLHGFYEQKDRLEKSTLYKILDKMPKGALHHVHTTAAPHVKTYIELTYDPVTYYNEREGLFKVFPDHQKEDGYV